MLTNKPGSFFETAIKVVGIVDVADPGVQTGVLDDKFQKQFLNFRSIFHTC
jgi:hypothetical protein